MGKATGEMMSNPNFCEIHGVVFRGSECESCHIETMARLRVQQVDDGGRFGKRELALLQNWVAASIEIGRQREYSG